MPVGNGQASHTSRPLTLVAIAATGVMAGAILGGTTNAVNGAVSPEYFVSVMDWTDVQHLWRTSVAQGILEGLLLGSLLSIVYSAVIGVITRTTCSYGFAAKRLIGIVAGVYACWALGGLAGVGLAALSPEHFQRAVIDPPEEFGALLRYAWVGGSIFGAQLGAVACLVLGLVVVRADWRREAGR